MQYVVGGKPFRVRARHVVMACWNRVTAHLVVGLPESQVENLCYARKVPLIYGRAALNNWQAFADARISSITPRGNSLFWDSTTLAAGARFGAAYGPTPNQPPTAPAMLSFQVVPTDHDATPQLAAYEGGRKRLLEMSFQDLEDALIDVIDRSVNRSGGNFEPERDIHSIMVNRWNYGYAHEMTSVWDPSLYGPNAAQPQVQGARAVPQRLDREQRLGPVRVHAQRDQRGLPRDPGPAGVIPWIVMALVAVPLVVVAFVAVRRRNAAGEHPANEDAQERERTEEEFAAAEAYEAKWREQDLERFHEERFP